MKKENKYWKDILDGDQSAIDSYDPEKMRCRVVFKDFLDFHKGTLDRIFSEMFKGDSMKKMYFPYSFKNIHQSDMLAKDIDPEYFEDDLKVFSINNKSEVIGKLSKEEKLERKSHFVRNVGEETKFKDALHIYLENDVMMLIRIVLKKRNDLLRISGIDPYEYISMFSFNEAWMLKKTELELVLLKDPTFYRELNELFTANNCKDAMNGTFGKSIEDVEKHSKVKLCTTEMTYKKAKSSPSYCGEYQIYENMMLVKIKDKEVNLNKHIYWGKVILDLAKMMLAKFVYLLFDFYGEENVTLFCTDTDSLHLMVSGYSTAEFYDLYAEIDKVIPIDRSGIKVEHGNFL